jgi:hypothetical protein
MAIVLSVLLSAFESSRVDQGVRTRTIDDNRKAPHGCWRVPYSTLTQSILAR